VGATTALPVEGYATTKSFAKANPNTMAAFKAALQQGQQIAASNRQVAEAATAKFGGLPPASAKQFTSVMQFESYPLGQVSVTRLQRVANIMIGFGLIGPFNVRRMLGD
jgi:NitT/TauT family transport system substrate-binding protein